MSTPPLLKLIVTGGVIMIERKPINIRVGKAIKNIRESAGLTQQQFAELISMGTKNISSVERGERGISIETLERICGKLNVSSDSILFGDRHTNDIDLLAERFSLLPLDEFASALTFFNNLFYTSAKQRK